VKKDPKASGDTGKDCPVEAKLLESARSSDFKGGREMGGRAGLSQKELRKAVKGQRSKNGRGCCEQGTGGPGGAKSANKKMQTGEKKERIEEIGEVKEQPIA